MIQLSPPLIAGQAEIDEMVGILGDVLSEASKMLDGGGARSIRRAPLIRSNRSRASSARAV